jgi:hypothetical protein
MGWDGLSAADFKLPPVIEYMICKDLRSSLWPMYEVAFQNQS